MVAERFGFREDEALSLGRALAGRVAQAKGRRLRIYKPHEQGPEQARQTERGEEFWIELLGTPSPPGTPSRASWPVRGDEVMAAERARRYLQSKFGADLAAARLALRQLARSLPPQDLAPEAFALYEHCRPKIPAGE